MNANNLNSSAAIMNSHSCGLVQSVHQSCNAVENINQGAYQIAADAIAKVVVELATKPNLREWLQLEGDKASTTKLC